MRRLADPYQRRRAIVDLHAEGWSNTAISAYLQTPRHRVYEVLKRWALFGHKGLEDIPQWHARKAGTRERAKSRACKISGTSLQVLFAALSTWGAPSAIGSSGGGIFYCNQAMDVYASLSIRKERIEPRQAWQNLIEAHFNIARRMADARFARARSWEEILAVHQRFVHDYNVQRHWAHESREDGCHSPAEVLGGQTGTMYPPSVLVRLPARRKGCGSQ